MLPVGCERSNAHVFVGECSCQCLRYCRWTHPSRPHESIRATRTPPNLKVPFHMFVPGAFRSLIHESIDRLFRLAKSASKKGGAGTWPYLNLLIALLGLLGYESNMVESTLTKSCSQRVWRAQAVGVAAPFWPFGKHLRTGSSSSTAMHFLRTSTHLSLTSSPHTWRLWLRRRRATCTFWSQKIQVVSTLACSWSATLMAVILVVLVVVLASCFQDAMPQKVLNANAFFKRRSVVWCSFLWICTSYLIESDRCLTSLWTEEILHGPWISWSVSPVATSWSHGISTSAIERSNTEVLWIFSSPDLHTAGDVVSFAKVDVFLAHGPGSFWHRFDSGVVSDEVVSCEQGWLKQCEAAKRSHLAMQSWHCNPFQKISIA